MYVTVRIVLFTSLCFMFDLKTTSQESVTTISYVDIRENYDNLENLANLNYDTFNITQSGCSEQEDDSNVLHRLPVQLRYCDVITNISDAKTLGLTENLVLTLQRTILIFLINNFILTSSSENENNFSFLNAIEKKDSSEYASVLIVSKEQPVTKVIQQLSLEADLELEFIDAKSVGIFKHLETQFDISPLKIKLDKFGNAIFYVHVRTGPCNKLIGFGTKRIYVQIHSTYEEHVMRPKLINFMSQILLVQPNNIKFKRGPGRNLKKIIVPVDSIKKNYAMKKLIETFKLSKADNMDHGLNLNFSNSSFEKR